MEGNYEYNPIYKLYIALKTYFKYNHDNNTDEYCEIDQLLKLILLNNGCKSRPDIDIKQSIYCMNNDYDIYFISGMIGNDINEFYDFIYFNGKKVLIIFIDFFDIKTNEEIKPNSPDFIMGNSVYYDAIKKIVEVFYITSELNPSGILTSAMATTQKWNKSIIAIHVLNEFKKVDENDVCDISMDDINKILNGNINLLLYGIRVI